MQATQTMKEIVQQKWTKRPLIISGPCSAETEEQVVETVQRIAATGKVDMISAGIWKPRTRPGSFEGIGVKRSAMVIESQETHWIANHGGSSYRQAGGRCHQF